MKEQLRIEVWQALEGVWGIPRLLADVGGYARMVARPQACMKGSNGELRDEPILGNIRKVGKIPETENINQIIPLNHSKIYL